jgi:type I restriction enzyme M protein
MSRETLNTQFWKACNILRQDDNTNSLLDYVEQISWLLFLKCLEELERRRRDEAEFEGKRYQPIIAAKYHWSAWTDPEKRLSGRDLLKFLNDELFPYLRELKGRQESDVIRGLFAETPSKMLKDGGILRDAIDAIQDIHFETAEDVHTLSHLYESMLAIRAASPGAAGRNRTLGIKKLIAIPVPLPPLAKQQEFSALRRQILAARALHKDLPAELDAIQAALLDQAFRGEL